VTHHPTVFKCEFVNHRQGREADALANTFVLTSEASAAYVASAVEHNTRDREGIILDSEA